MSLYLRPVDAGIGDILYQMSYFELLCRAIGIELDYNFVSLKPSRRNIVDQSLQQLLFGDDPLAAHDWDALPKIRFVDFVERCLQQRTDEWLDGQPRVVVPWESWRSIYDGEHTRNTIIERFRLGEQRTDFARQLQQGELYRRYAAEQRVPASRTVLMHYRAGDVAVFRRTDVPSWRVRRLFNGPVATTEGFVAEGNMDDLEPGTQARHIELDAYHPVIAKLCAAPETSLTICSDGYTRLADFLFRTERNRLPLTRRRLVSRKGIEDALNRGAFAPFSRYQPTLIVGEQSEKFYSTVKACLDATTIVRGGSWFPVILRSAFGHPAPEVINLARA